MIQELEKVAQLSREEAKKLLTEEILEETRHDVAIQVRTLEQKAKDEADINAKKLIALAIQKCAADQASEITVSVVPLPNDDMKARIIGREGRNIRALENATGIELIVDDTPEVVILSGFDPVRREIARLSLEKLINDGRIHPARIEETVEKVKKEREAIIVELTALNNKASEVSSSKGSSSGSSSAKDEKQKQKEKELAENISNIWKMDCF